MKDGLTAYATGGGPADPNVHIADIRAEQVRDGRLEKSAPPRRRNGRHACRWLARRPRRIGSIHRNRRLGGVGFGAR
jgi:hypothetical protein